MTFISLHQKQNKNKHSPTHLAGSLNTSHQERLHLISSLMGSKPIHRRTDVPLDGKEKSQTPELPSQPFTLEDSELCFVRGVAQKVPLAKGCGCKNGLMPSLCCRDSSVLQEPNPLPVKWAAAGADIHLPHLGCPGLYKILNKSSLLPSEAEKEDSTELL